VLEVEVEVEVDGSGGAVDVVTGAAVVVVAAIGTSDVGGTVSLAEVQPDTTSTKDTATSPAERTRTVIGAVAW
jgi:hypothetical protein